MPSVSSGMNEGLRRRVVGAFRRRHALDRAAAEARGIFRDLLLEGVSGE
jgi:hypothetical protein